MTQRLRFAALSAAGICVSTVVAAENFQLPPEVTPALRAACEADVRRLCIDVNPTVAKVKRCVAVKFHQLNTRCKAQIAVAGLMP